MVTKARQGKIKAAVKNKLADVRVVLEDVRDPHNAAAILRTCDALGVGSVWYLFQDEEPYNPRKVGKLSSSTANKWVDIEVFEDRSSIEAALRDEGFVSVATTIHEDVAETLWESDFVRDKIALWVGNETRGLSPHAIRFCGRHVTMPMVGMVESLNVSVAAAIFLAEIVPQKRTGE